MEKSHEQWSRRKFINTLTGTGALLMLNPSSLWAADETETHVDAILSKTIGIDTRNHIVVPLHAAELSGPLPDLSGEMKKSGLSAICMTFALDYQKRTAPGEAYDTFTNGSNAMDALLKNNRIERALTIEDLRRAHKTKTPTVIQAVEGAHFLEGRIDRLTEAYNRGLRHLTLLPDDTDAPVSSDNGYNNAPQWGGLTAFGAEVIKECNRLGILVDLTHANNETITDALNVTTRPVIISYTGLDTQLAKNACMSKMIRPRLISKEQAKIIAANGGVIGVWTHLSDTPVQYAQNLRALVDVVGVEHVCISTDTKLTPSYSESHDRTNQNAVGIKSRQIVERTNEVWENQKTGFYYTLIDALLKTGFTEKEIAFIGGGNYCRVFEAATKKNVV